MKRKNKYVNRSKISDAEFRHITKLFCLDLNAVGIAKETGLNRNTVNRYLNGIRIRIAEYCNRRSSLSGGLTDFKEKCLNCQSHGRCGWFFEGKAALYTLISNQGKVFVEPVPDLQSLTLQRIMLEYESHGAVTPNIWHRHDGLVDIGCMKCIQGNRCKNKHHCHFSNIGDIEEFLEFTNARLRKFRGISKSFFYLHLKECEFRFNYRAENLFQIIIKIFRDQPMF